MKKNGLLLLAGFALLLGLFLIPGTNTEAASKVSLSTNSTYTSYDVTGDGEKDSIRLVTSGYRGLNWYDTLYVYINGNLSYTVNYDSEGCAYEGYILTLNNGKPYLYIQGFASSDYGPRYLLEYDNSTGKCKVVADFVKMFEQKSGYHFYVNNIIVKKNKITFNVDFTLYSMGGTNFKITYQYKSGKLVQLKKLGFSKKTMTANKKIKTYKTSSCKKKSYTIKKGQKVQIIGLRYSGNKLAIKVKVKGKTAWISPLRKYPTKYQFKEAVYAG